MQRITFTTFAGLPPIHYRTCLTVFVYLCLFAGLFYSCCRGGVYYSCVETNFFKSSVSIFIIIKLKSGFSKMWVTSPLILRCNITYKNWFRSHLHPNLLLTMNSGARNEMKMWPFQRCFSQEATSQEVTSWLCDYEYSPRSWFVCVMFPSHSYI